MAEVYERVGPIAGTGSEATLKTADSGARYLLYLVNVCNTTTTVQTFKLTIGADAAGTRLVDDLSVPNDTVVVVEWPAGIPFSDQETLRWNGPTTLTLTATIAKQVDGR